MDDHSSKLCITCIYLDLTQMQADKLWDCLTTITGTTGINREELYNWLLNQLKNRDGGHALSLDTFKHLLIEKVCRFIACRVD
jgi:hypothetical protein